MRRVAAGVLQRHRMRGPVPGTTCMSAWDLTDPFKAARASSGVLAAEFAGETIPMILRHADVRRAARDFRAFSSDAPFRVPIPGEEPFRDVRELPIETDPPEHTAWRALAQPFFERPRQPDVIEAVGKLTSGLLDAVLGCGPFDVIRDFAVKLQSRALALMLKRPPEDGRLWENWNTNLLYDDASRAELYRYLDRVLTDAAENPGVDLFGTLSAAVHDGRKLTRDEILGFAILTFAGGRDTVVSVIAFALVHLAGHPEDLDRLRGEPGLIRTAAEEFVRVCSPLTHIGRTCPAGADINGVRIPPGHRASLCWAAANRDETVFPDADTVRIDRRGNVHVAYGAGPHTCLGAHQARLILRSVLQQVAKRVSRIDFLHGEPKYEAWPAYRRQTGYEALNMALHPVRNETDKEPAP